MHVPHEASKPLSNQLAYYGVERSNESGHMVTPDMPIILQETTTSGKGGDTKKQAEPITEVVGRAYAFRRPKKGGLAAEELKAALEKEVPREQDQNPESKSIK